MSGARPDYLGHPSVQLSVSGASPHRPMIIFTQFSYSLSRPVLLRDLEYVALLTGPSPIASTNLLMILSLESLLEALIPVLVAISLSLAVGTLLNSSAILRL